MAKTSRVTKREMTDGVRTEWERIKNRIERRLTVDEQPATKKDLKTFVASTARSELDAALKRGRPRGR